jgi:hypothetical protein
MPDENTATEKTTSSSSPRLPKEPVAPQSSHHDHDDNHHKVPIQILLEELDMRGISYPPNATRQQLQELLLLAGAANATPAATSTSSTTSTTTKKAEQVEDIISNAASYPPIPDAAASSLQEDAQKPPWSNNKTSSSQQQSSRPIRRGQQRELSRKKNTNTEFWNDRQKEEEEVEGDDDDDDNSGSKRLPKTWEDLWSQTSKGARSIPRRVSNAGDKATKKIFKTTKEVVQQAQKTIRSQAKEDEEGIVDAIIVGKHIVIEYDEDDNIVEVEPTRDDEWKAKAKAKAKASIRYPTSGSFIYDDTPREYPKRKRRSSSPSQQQARASATRGRRPPPSRRASPTTTRTEFSSNEGTFSSSSNDAIPRLPPVGFDGEEFPPRTTNNERRTRKRRTTRDSNEKRKIYSPYGDWDDNKEDDIFKDGIDQFGDVVANTVDSFLWGSETDDSSNRRKPAKNRTTGPRRRKKTRSGYWKDRMEENFDYMMGIHKDGKYYDRWANQEMEDEGNAEGTDSVSYARGRSSRGKKIPQKPIWEEENLLSMLFGTDDRNRFSMFDRSPSNFGSGSLLRLFRSLLQSFSVFAGSVGRWASVRGALPQPVVVVGVIAAGLSSRPGRRFRNIVIALVAMRTVGELLHGYAYDDSDFGDDDAPDSEESLDKDDPYQGEDLES